MPKSSSAGVARGATYIFVQGFIASLVGVAYIMVVTRTLSETQRGVYAIFNLVLSIVQVFGTFALSYASTNYIAKYIAEGTPEKARSIVSRVLEISIISFAAIFILLSILAEFLSSSLLSGQAEPSLFQVLAVASVLNILYMQVTAFIQGIQRILELAIVGAIYAFFQNVIGIYLLSIGFGLWGILYGWIAGLVLSISLGLAFTGKFLGFSRSFHPMRPLFRFSLPLYLSSILSFFVAWIDQILVLLILSTSYGLAEAQRVLGLYYIAVRASIVLSLIASSIVTALFPKLSEIYAQGGVPRLREAFRASTRYATLISFPMIIGLATLAYPVMILFAGWGFVEAAWPLTILCLSMLPSALGAAIGPTLLTLERIKEVSLASVVHIICEAAISYVLIIPLGMPGAAWSRVAASVISTSLAAWFVKKSIGIALDKETLWKSSFSSILMVLALVSLDVLRQHIAYGAIHISQFLVFSLRFLPVYIAVGAVAYLLSLVALKAIKKHDIDLLRDYLPKGLKWIAAWLGRIARVK